MAMASARLLSRRISRISFSSISNSGHSEARVLSTYLSSLSRANVDLNRGNEAVRFRSLSHLVPFGRVYSTDVGEDELGLQKEDLAQMSEEAPKASIKPPPRPFKLNNEQRELAEEIGYKVVDRYTEEDFGQNKRPKAFAVVQVCFSPLLLALTSTDLAGRIFGGEYADD